MNAGKYGRSSAALKELLALDPSNMEARRLFATLHLRLGSLIPARQAFDALITEAFERQDYWLAESLLREYLAAGPRCVPFLEKLGRVYEEKGDTLEAAAEYGKAIDILIEDPDPDNPGYPSQLYAKIRELGLASPVAIRLAPLFDAQTGALIAHPPAGSSSAVEEAEPDGAVVENLLADHASPHSVTDVTPEDSAIEESSLSAPASTVSQTTESLSLLSATPSPIGADDAAVQQVALQNRDVRLSEDTVHSEPADVAVASIPAEEPISISDPARETRSQTAADTAMVDAVPTSQPSSDVGGVKWDHAVPATESNSEMTARRLSVPEVPEAAPPQEPESFLGRGSHDTAVSAPMPWEHVQDATIEIPQPVLDNSGSSAALRQEGATVSSLLSVSMEPAQGEGRLPPASETDRNEPVQVNPIRTFGEGPASVEFIPPAPLTSDVAESTNLHKPPAIQDAFLAQEPESPPSRDTTISAPMPWEHVQEATIDIPQPVSDDPTLSAVLPAEAAATPPLSSALLDSSQQASDESTMPSATRSQDPTPEPLAEDRPSAAAASVPGLDDVKSGRFSWDAIFNRAGTSGNKVDGETTTAKREAARPEAAGPEADNEVVPPSLPPISPSVDRTSLTAQQPTCEGGLAGAPITQPMPWEQVQDTSVTIPPPTSEEAPVDELTDSTTISGVEPVLPPEALNASGDHPADQALCQINDSAPAIPCIDVPPAAAEVAPPPVMDSTDQASVKPEANEDRAFLSLRDAPLETKEPPAEMLASALGPDVVHQEAAGEHDATPALSPTDELLRPVAYEGMERSTKRFDETSASLSAVVAPLSQPDAGVPEESRDREENKAVASSAAPAVEIDTPLKILVGGEPAGDASSPSSTAPVESHVPLESGGISSTTSGEAIHSDAGKAAVQALLDSFSERKDIVQSTQDIPVQQAERSWEFRQDGQAGDMPAEVKPPNSDSALQQEEWTQTGDALGDVPSKAAPGVALPRTSDVPMPVREPQGDQPDEVGPYSAEPNRQQEEWIRTGESIRFIQDCAQAMEATPLQAGGGQADAAVSRSTAAEAVDVLFSSSGRHTKTAGQGAPATKPRRWLRPRLARIRIAVTSFLWSCFSTTHAIVKSIVALIALLCATAVLAIGAVGLLWLIMEESPSPAYLSMTTTPEQKLSDPRHNGYLLLLGFDATGLDAIQAGYERKPDGKDAERAAGCLVGPSNVPGAGQANASASLASSWFRGADPVSRIKTHEETIKGWVQQKDGVLSRYRQWVKLPFEDWGYGRPMAPPCGSVLFAHQLYLAEGFLRDSDSGMERLELDMEVWRTALAQAKTLPMKILAVQAVQEDIAVASGLLVRPDFDNKHLTRMTKLLRPLDQGELSIRWPMQSELVTAAKTFDARVKIERDEDRPFYTTVASVLPLPKQRRFNQYAEYYEASFKAAGEGRYGSMPKRTEYLRFPAGSVLDYLSNPIETVIGLEPLSEWDRYHALVVDTDAHLRLASLQAWLRRGPQDADLLGRIAKAGQRFYDPYTGLPMLVNLRKGAMYSVGHDGKDQDADPQDDIVAAIPGNSTSLLPAKGLPASSGSR